MEGIIDIGQPIIGARRGLIDFGRALHVQGFVRTFVVEDLGKFVKARLLLKKIGSGGLVASFFKVRCMRS